MDELKAAPYNLKNGNRINVRAAARNSYGSDLTSTEDYGWGQFSHATAATIV
jgi:hypothetical protein